MFNVASTENAHQRYKKFIDHVVSREENLTKKNILSYWKLFALKAFDTIRKLFPESLLKLKVISGDVSSEGLGISHDDELELIENVGIIFHCAAVVRFDFSLMDVMKTNVLGTHRILELAEKMKHFVSFIYVSTTFSQSYQSSLEERYYSTGFDVFALMNSIKANDKQSIDAVEKK